MWVVTHAACDPQLRCWKYVSANFAAQVACFYKQQAAFLDGYGECWKCHKSHKVSEKTQNADCLTSTHPCQAFSQFRARRGNTERTGKPSAHPDLYTSVWEFLAIVRKLHPKGGINENVMQIDSKENDDFRPAAFETWAQVVVHELRQMGYFVWTVVLNHAAWIDVPRKRWYCIYLDHRLGGARALRWMRSRLVDPTIILIISTRHRFCLLY